MSNSINQFTIIHTMWRGFNCLRT